MAVSHVAICIFFALILSTFAAQLKAPFKQCSRMYKSLDRFAL
ncbi:unnamed protein product, partial [Rotaria socialis]